MPEEKKIVHVLKQRGGGRILWPHRNINNRPDMQHVEGYFEEGGKFTETGPYRGKIEVKKEDKDPLKMGKKAITAFLTEDLGVKPADLEGLKITELRDMAVDIMNSNEELEKDHGLLDDKG